MRRKVRENENKQKNETGKNDRDEKEKEIAAYNIDDNVSDAVPGNQYICGE